MLKDFSLVKQRLFATDLPMHTYLFDLCSDVCDILEKEITEYREIDREGAAGSLLDFSKNPLPTIVVPDIHARPDYIYKILNYKLPKELIDYSDRTVFHALKKNLVRIICVGDALHTEKTYARWKSIEVEFNAGVSTGNFMSEEMLEGLNTICGMMMLKKLFPENVHFLKGNHENIMNRTGNGDYGFIKYADEGNMVRKFMFDMYGDDVIYMISCIEKALPLISVNQNFVVSHGEPADYFSKTELINARHIENGKIIKALTWTNNGDSKEGSVSRILKELSGSEDIEDWFYFGGHRPVPEDYLLRQNGKYVQIHNPSKQNIVFIKPDEKIDLEKIIVHLDKAKKNK